MPIKDFLQNAQTDIAVRGEEEKSSFLEKSSSNMPLIDDVELRIRNDAFDVKRQRYSLRVEPRGFGETSASRELYNRKCAYHTSRKRFLLNRVLKEHYSSAIDYIELEKLLALRKELLMLYQDRITVYKKTGADVDHLVDADDDFMDLETEIIEQEKNLNILNTDIRQKTGVKDFTGFDTSGIICVDSVCLFVEKINFDIDSANLYLQNARLDFLVTESEYQLEQAQGRRYISFLEFSYDDGEMYDQLERKNYGREYNLNEAYIFELGLRIPYVNMDRHDVNRRKLRYLSDTYDYKILDEELRAKLKKDSADIKVLIDKYKVTLAREQDVDAEKSLKKYLDMEGIEPERLLAIKESVIKNKIRRQKIRFDILRNYIRVLDICGKLVEKPLRNHLSSNREPIAP